MQPLFRYGVFWILILVFSSGCSGSREFQIEGSERLNRYTAEEIVTGMPQQEVIDKLGEPALKDPISGGGERWTFVRTETRVETPAPIQFAAQPRTRYIVNKLLVDFNEAGLVIQVRYDEVGEQGYPRQPHDRFENRPPV